MTNNQVKSLSLTWISEIKNVNAAARTKDNNNTVRFELSDIIPEGERNGTLFRYAASLRAAKVLPTQIGKELKAINLSRCTPPLSEREIANIYNSVLRYPEGTSIDYNQYSEIEQHIKRPGTQPVNFAEAFIAGLPELEREIIREILRKGGKLLITASSKAGKTQILVLLTIALSEGGLWLGTIQCEKAKVLFVNFELTPAQMYRRFESAYWAMKKSPVNSDFSVWNLKGQYDQIFPVEKNFVPRLISIVKEQQFDVVILDPIYKLFTEDENSSKTISEFTRYTDRIVQETGCSLIYSHHHSKGAQGQKSAIDRGSGSGVFGRDADAVMDFLEIEPKDCAVTLEEGQAAYRIEIGGLRSFKMYPSFEVVSEFPLFIPRDDLKLAKAKYGCSDPITNAKRGNAKKQQDRDKDINILREFVRFVVESGGTYSLDDAVEAMNKSKSTIREWVKIEGSGMEIHNNNLYLVSTGENNENE